MKLLLIKKTKIIITIIAGLVLFSGAGVVTYTILRHYETDPSKTISSHKDDAQVSHIPKPNEVTSNEELSKLSVADKHAFCLDFPVEAAAPPIEPSLYQKMGIDAKRYESLAYFCYVNAMSEEFTRKDKSGENDEFYYSTTQKSKDMAKVATFDLYDTTYAPKNTQITKRVIATAPNDAPSIFIEYSTLVEGEYRLFISKQVIQVYVFDIREFTENDSNCGPVLMYRKSSLQMGGCTATDQKFLNTVIYEDSDASTVTIGHTRIKVKARNNAEALTILKSMKRTNVDQFDFFAKS